MHLISLKSFLILPLLFRRGQSSPVSPTVVIGQDMPAPADPENPSRNADLTCQSLWLSYSPAITSSEIPTSRVPRLPALRLRGVSQQPFDEPNATAPAWPTATAPPPQPPLFLKASCETLTTEWAASALDLNLCLASQGGILTWKQFGGFSSSCRACGVGILASPEFVGGDDGDGNANDDAKCGINVGQDPEASVGLQDPVQEDKPEAEDRYAIRCLCQVGNVWDDNTATWSQIAIGDGISNLDGVLGCYGM